MANSGILLFLGIIVACSIMLAPFESHAAIGTTTQNWPATPVYSNAAYPAAAINYNAVAGNNRLLVVGISSSTTAVNQPQPTVTYGGTAMTYAIGTDVTATQQHSYLFYLPLGSSASADTGKTIAVTISGGTSRYCTINAAVYTGVDQAAPVASPVRSSNNTTAGTAVGPFTMAVNSGEMGISVLNAVGGGAGKSNAATIAIGATGHLWSQVSTTASNRIIGSLRTTFATTLNANTVTATQHTSSVATLNSTAAITIKPLQGITVTNGSTVAGNKNVYVNDGANSLNVVVDAFAMTADALTNVTGITFTANANTTSANISGINVWRKVGPTPTVWESGDVQVGATATATGGAVTISGLSEPVSTVTQNYIVTYDIAPGAAASTANILTGTITAIAPAAISLTDTSAFSASIYIYPTTTIGNGSEPTAARLWKSSAATNLDAFTLAHNSSNAADNDDVTTVTVTMAPQYISGGSGGTISKIKLMEIVGAGCPSGVCGTASGATAGDTWNITTTGLTAGVNEATYYVRVTTADTITPSLEDTSDSPEGIYTFTGTITGVVHSKAANRLVENDSSSASLVIDVEKPTGPATATATTGALGGEIELVWVAASDASAGSLDAATPYLVRRSDPDGTQPSPGCTDGTAVTLSPANQTDRRFTDTGLVDTTPTRYYYRVCAKDAQGNISDGAASYANSKVTSDCNNPPTVTLAYEDGGTTAGMQIIKSSASAPFRLQIANNDVGSCPDVDFTVVLANVVGNESHFTKTIDGGPFPGTVTLGTGGGGASTGKTVNVVVTGIEAAGVLQLEQYKFAVTVSSPGNNHGAPITTAQVTGLLNDMPPIVHNSANMAKYQYGSWGQNYTCATCHSNSTTNIKGIYQIISSPIGRRNVVFTTTSSTVSVSTGVYGNDLRAVQNGTTNVCEVCHHKTRQHQYSANKQFGGPGNDETYNTDHHNSRDCVKCHTHNTAFRSIYGLCGDCHGFKATGYSPVNKTTMVKDLTNALGPNPPNYGAHTRHIKANISCGACHNNTNHGLQTTAWSGNANMEMGFAINKDTFAAFNPNAGITGGTFYGTNNLNSPFVWVAGPGTTITPIADYNASCNTYCHGNWSGNTGSNTSPLWVGSNQAVCGGCHDATGSQPPATGSHVKHAATSGAGLGIACINCHGTYGNYTGSAHINGKVEWNLSAYTGGAYNAASAGDTNAPAPTPPASYGVCSNLYCHSNIQGAGGNGTGDPTSYATPKWGDASTAACGTCHIVPNTTGSHANHENAEVAFDCHACHNDGGTTSPLNHANGTINFQFVGLAQNTVYSLGNSVAPGTAYGSCSSSDCHGRSTRIWGTAASELQMCDKCHGSRTSAGFYGTGSFGSTLSIYSAGIGVHDIHLQNANSPRKATFSRFTSYAAGFNCNQCHYTPTSPFSAGHIDTAVPAEVPFSHVSSIANTGQAKFSYYSAPKYTSATQSCSAIWCHGAGMNSNNATGPYLGVSGSIQRQNPQWNVPYLTGNGATDCVKCHAMPPPAPDSGYIHFGKTMVDCKDCHTHLNADGLGFKNKALHVNGEIDGGCDKCHGYPPINNIVGDHEGLATPAQGALRLGTAGAHNAHALNATIGKNCQTCHYNYSSGMPSNNLEIGFNGFNGAVVSGTFTGYSNSGVHPNWLSTNAGTVIQKVTSGANVCSNLYCHGGGTATLPALSGGSNTTPNWEGGAGDASCGTCHGADTTNAPSGGSHNRHALSANGGMGMLCVSCHGSSVNMTHVNGAVSWSLDRANPAIGVNATYNNISSGTITGLAPRNNGADYRSCNNVYCHSDVQGTDGPGKGEPTSYKTVTWGDNTLTCGSCHKNMAIDAAPTGSHLKHANTGAANMALTCGYCHQDGGSGSLNHADNQIFVNFTSYVGGSYSNNNRVAGSAAGYGACATTFCHGTAASPVWGTAGPLACNACHSAKVDDVSWSGRHKTHYNYSTMPTNYTQTVTDLSTTNKYRFNCAHCHDDNIAKHSLKPASADSAARVFFGISSATPAASSKRGLYVAGTPQGATDNGFKFTAGSCNSIYCHSNGRGGAPLNNTLTWVTTPTAGSNCAYCHDTKSTTAAATQLSGKHDKHMNPTNNAMIGTGNGFNCVDCHAGIITDINNTTIANKAKHVNAMLDYSGARANKNYDSSSKICSNVYCHSNGNAGAVVFVSMTGSKIWSGAATITTCNKCHGRSTSTGYPDYANGGANTATSNLHAGHMSGLTDTLACADCHRRTADTIAVNKFRPYSTLHLSGGPNVAFNKTRTYVGANANVATVGNQVTCSNIVCHGQGAPVWGASNPTTHQCQKCHGDKSTAFGTFSSPQVAPGYNGTGTDTSMVNAAATSPRVGAHQRHLVSNVIAAPIKCGECHVSVTNIRSGNHWNYSTATLTFSGRATANGHTPTVSRTGGIISCSTTNCHTGKYNSGTTLAPFWNMTGLVKETGTTIGQCTKCHAMPPSGYASHPAALSDSAAISTIYGACGSCHANLSNSATNVGNVFTDKSLHVNGTMNYVANCNGCHAYDLTGGGTTWTPALGGGAGTGAHIKHIAYIKSRLNIVSLTASGQTYGLGEPAGVCGTCHSNNGTDHDNGARQITFGAGGASPNTMGAGYGNSMDLLFGGSAPSFNGGAKSCSNIICHYAATPNWY